MNKNESSSSLLVEGYTVLEPQGIGRGSFSQSVVNCHQLHEATTAMRRLPQHLPSFGLLSFPHWASRRWQTSSAVATANDASHQEDTTSQPQLQGGIGWVQSLDIVITFALN
eukprot:1160007-Pelagomonas_calceolata.AAC.9